MSLLAWVGIVVGAGVGVTIAGFAYLAVVLAWEDESTRSGRYYRLPKAERLRFRERLRRHARVLHPVVRLGSRMTTVTLPKASFRYEGIAGPSGSCTEDSFRAGHAYDPRPEDVFVVTQMKCGTTWMQHVVYQVLTRGRGGLAERGEALYAISPWLEGVKSVPMSEAPLIGEERPSRLIKTHFPVELCPFDPRARYIYVARHPVSCFASCADFIAANLGAFAPDLEAVRAWFCSEDMWWGSWPRHVEGWWRRARDQQNVLFVRFEEMRADLRSVTCRVAEHLGMRSLNDQELSSAVSKCGFEYMRRHADSFEMLPPHLLAIDAELFVKGTADRYADVPDRLRRAVMEWCEDRMAGSDFPLREVYAES